MIDFIKGDVIAYFKATDNTMLAHQANCFGINGAGIAGTLFREFEEIRQFPFENESLFGDNTFTHTKHGIIVNMHAQFKPGRCVVTDINDKDSFVNRLKALESCLQKINNNKLIRTNHLVMPLVASGIAADYRLKDGLTDFDYFTKYIAPTVNRATKGMIVTVFYL